MPHRKSTKPATKPPRKAARAATRTNGTRSSGSGGASSARPTGRAAASSRQTSRPTNRPSTRQTTHEVRTPPAPEVTPVEPVIVSRTASLPPHELYRHEKRRRANQPRADGRDPLEEARREFKAMLEAGAGTPRGGRPRKVKPSAEDEEA
jgi:hypothetical protein